MVKFSITNTYGVLKKTRRDGKGVKYLHFPITASAGDMVVVSLDSQANVRLLDPINYLRYRRGEQHESYGGLACASLFRLRIPRTGEWHIAIDLGGYAGGTRAGVQLIS